MADPHLPDLPVAQRVLIYHQRRDIGSCLCGWGNQPCHLGKSHAAHVLTVLRQHPDVIDGMAEAMAGWPMDTAAVEDAEAWRANARAALAYLTGGERDA